MEYQLGREAYPVCEPVLETVSEQPVDLDVTLPDYCPDVEKILKCRVRPCVTGKSINGDRLEVDGSALISLYYLDAKKRAIRMYEHTVPFSCGFALKSACEDPVAVVRLKTDYLNCRALSPRRIDIHGAFSVCVCVYARGSAEYCNGVEGQDIQQKKHRESLSRLCGLGQQQFSVAEVLDIGQGKGMPESILRNELFLKVESQKAIEDKLMLNGEAVLRILYVTDIESGALDTMTFHVPFTQVLDIRGIHSESENQLILEVLSFETALKSEYDENSTLITLDARIGATVLGFESAETEIVDDVYSTEYELSLNEITCSFLSFLPVTEEVFSVSSEVDTGENGITQMLDLWCDGISSMCSLEQDHLQIKGKLTCCILALDGQGVPFYIERPLEFSTSHHLPAFSGEANIKADLTNVGISFRITGDNSISVKADLRLGGGIWISRHVRAIVGVDTRDDQLRMRDRTAALTIYYADPGEHLWDIARQYCTSVEALRLENEMTEDEIPERRMLLIPM